MDRIHPELGDSRMPPAPVSGGSMTTASVLPAVRQAAAAALKRIVQAAIADEKSPLHGKREDEVVAANGRVFLQDSAPESGISYGQVLAATNQAAVEGESFMQPGKEREKYAFQSWGVQFVGKRLV
jgi:xanthine dehydrogenase YagR molybdenum-binding subunit